MDNITIGVALVGGVVLICIMGGVLWLITAGIVDVFDWLFGAVESAIKKAVNRW